MQQYRFETLVDMIMAAKLHLPPDKPLHLFGAGHPMMFAFAVALGCDMFDSGFVRAIRKKWPLHDFARYLEDRGAGVLPLQLSSVR